MGRNPGSTKIHDAGIADEVADVIKKRWPLPQVKMWIKEVFGLDLELSHLYYFRDNFIEKSEMVPVAGIRGVHEEEAELVNISRSRARAIVIQEARVAEVVREEYLLASEDDPAAVAGRKIIAARGSRLGPELDRLNKLLDAHREDQVKMGIFQAPAPVGGTQVNIAMMGAEPPIKALAIEQQMIAGGVDPADARRYILRAVCGPERLGEGQPTPVRCETLDDSGGASDVRGACLPRGALRRDSAGAGHQEGGSDGDKRVPDSR